MLRLVCTLAQLYAIAVIARVILSYLQVPGRHPVGQGVAVLGKLVDPPLRYIGRFLPPIRLGEVRLDLSPLVLLVGLTLLTRIICG